MSGILAAMPVAPPGANVVYVGKSNMDYNQQSPTLASIGAVAGDLGVAFVTSSNRVYETASGSGEIDWNVAGGAGAVNIIFYKKLVSSDLSRTVAINPSSMDPWCLAIYRGGNSVSYISRTSATAAGSNNAPGFNKAVRHGGIIAATFNQTNLTPDDVLTPASWASRFSFARVQAWNFADRLNSTNTIYQNGTPIGWTANGNNTDSIQLHQIIA